jgi:heme/copper-type cytochrome/quinol oxidase subunit 2
MQDQDLSKYTVPFGLSLAICAVLNALLVATKEKSKTVAAWMQRMTGHHWITHVVIVLAAFFALGLALAQTNRAGETKISADRLTRIVIAGIVVGTSIIAAFYLIAD